MQKEYPLLPTPVQPCPFDGSHRFHLEGLVKKVNEIYKALQDAGLIKEGNAHDDQDPD